MREIMEHLAPLTSDFTLSLRYSDLSVWMTVPEAYISTVWTSFRDTFLRCFCPAKKSRFNLIQNITGNIRAGTMTLVVGPPGSGKSTFMKTLSGRLHRTAASIHVDGEILYNGDTVASHHFLLPKIIDYIDQDDTHEPTLTVSETFEFAFRAVSGGHHSYGLAKDADAAAKLDLLDPNYVKVRLLGRYSVNIFLYLQLALR